MSRPPINYITLLIVVTIFTVSAQQVQLGIVTERSMPIAIYWIDNNGNEVLNIQQLKELSHSWLTSYIGHRFVAKEIRTGNVVDEHVVAGNEIWVIKDQEASYTGCDLFGNIEDYRTCFSGLRDVQNNANLLEQRQRNVEFRIVANAEQPPIVPEFTAVGFEKVRVPDDIWSLILEYYNHNLGSYARENWGLDNTVVNFWDSPTYMIPLPESGPIKPEIYASIQRVLEEWIGGNIPLEPTSMYGIRLYLNNSVLENHVDRLKTHAVSAIINVDQDVSRPWKLHIFDHDNVLHEIEMAPGDMVLYESARAVHGRPIPLQGRYYANFFTHFAPVNKDLWPFTSDNHRLFSRQ